MMQIFQPFPSVKKNVMVLSEADLNHQRNCALTILEAISTKAKGWRWHPGVNMWWGSETLLAHIAITINEEWAQQLATTKNEPRASFNGLVKAYEESLVNLGFKLRGIKPSVGYANPWWWGDKRYHQGEQAALVRHDSDWYRQFFPDVDAGLCEWWPRKDKGKFVYGPHIGPNGDFDDYHIDDTPILKRVRSMSNEDFAHHANVYHNLMPDLHEEIKPKDVTIGPLRSLHDRFHQKRIYHSHEHIS